MLLTGQFIAETHKWANTAIIALHFPRVFLLQLPQHHQP